MIDFVERFYYCLLITNDKRIRETPVLKRKRELQSRYPNWTVSDTGGGHLKLRHKTSRKLVFAAATPSDHRADRRLDALMKRMEKQ